MQYLEILRKGAIALSKKNSSHLGDRGEYIGASELGLCPARVILGKVYGSNDSEDTLDSANLKNLGHIQEDYLEARLLSQGFKDIEREYEIQLDHHGVQIQLHLDFVWRTPKVVLVIESKNMRTIPSEPWDSQVIQMNAQVCALKLELEAKGDNRQVLGIIHASARATGEETVFPAPGEFYHPDFAAFRFYLDKAVETWDLIEAMRNGASPRLPIEPGPLCNWCSHIAMCPRFQRAHEVPEMIELVRQFNEAKAVQKEAKQREEDFKAQMLAIVSQVPKGWVKVEDEVFVKSITRTQTRLNTDKVKDYLRAQGEALVNFQNVTSSVGVSVVKNEPREKAKAKARAKAKKGEQPPAKADEATDDAKAA